MTLGEVAVLPSFPRNLVSDRLAVVYGEFVASSGGAVFLWEIIVGRGYVSRSVETVPVIGRDAVTGFRSEYIAASIAPASPCRWFGDCGGDEPVLEVLYVESIEE